MTHDVLPPKAVAALKAGDKLGASKEVRRITGMGLAEAKAWVENYERGGPAPAPMYDHPPERNPNATIDISPASMQALEEGNPADAIRDIRKSTGVGAEEAKAIAEEIRKNLPAGFERKARALLGKQQPKVKLAPGQVAEGSAMAKWVVLVVLAAIVVAAAVYF